MSTNAATIRELRINFRSVKRKIEQHGEVTITDRGRPAYLLKALSRPTRGKPTGRDYYARLVQRQPKSMSAKETSEFWERERG